MSAIRASQWLSLLERPATLRPLSDIYGSDDALLDERAALARRTLEAFRDRFGDLPVRLFRAPGRVNLRGMHVDTHGGFLNLMTHQREVMLAAAAADGPTSALANVVPAFSETVFNLDEERRGPASNWAWWDVIADPAVAARSRARAATPETAWANYCIGAALRVAHEYPDSPPGGLKIMVHSDLPRGAALSSSAALSVAALLASASYAGHTLAPEQIIAAEQDVEWYAGARVGMSDQTAIVLGRPGMLLNIAVFPRDFTLDNARYVPFPAALDLLVVDSHTKRTLSGAHRLQYTLNRFAYSMALTVLQAELVRSGWSLDAAQQLDRLSRITPDALGGAAVLYELLQRIPETISLETLRKRYAPPELDSEYVRYFGEGDAADRPRRIPLRGPLLFGIAESERARVFPDALASGDYEEAGMLMNVGHDGDRVRVAGDAPYVSEISDMVLEILARDQAPVVLQPGAYGASSPALDMLVDAALHADALGASLTGAGIAGAVLVLCHREHSSAIRVALARILQTEAYARSANLAAPLDEDTADKAVTINHSVAGACEVCLDS